MKRRPRLVSVHVSGWEIGCCVPTPGIGDHVSWYLYLHCPPDPGPEVLDDPGQLTRHWRVERGGGGMLVTDGVVQAAVGPMVAPVPEPGEAELTGILVTDFHRGAMQGLDPVGGRVRRVQVLTQLIAWQDERRPGRLEWVAGSVWAYDVARSPKYFESHPPDDDGPRRQETGILVDLEV